MRPDHIPAERDLPGSASRREHLVAELGAWDSTFRQPRRGLRLVAIPAALVLLAATGLTAYAVVRGPTHVETIGCYEQASLQAKVTVLNADERTPTELCGGEIWRTGEFGQVGTIPQLTACVLPNGRIGVFPGRRSTMCSELGLADLPPDFPDAAAQLAGLKAAIGRQLGQCADESMARAIVGRELVVRGYSDWKVEVVGDFTTARPCADVSFDTGAQTVVLVPGSRG